MSRIKQRSAVLSLITVICAFYLWEMLDSGIIGTFALYGIDLLKLLPNAVSLLHQKFPLCCLRRGQGTGDLIGMDIVVRSLPARIRTDLNPTTAIVGDLDFISGG